MVHVSAVNDCAVCTAAHTALGRATGVSEDALACAREQRLPADPRVRTALRYAELRTRAVEHQEPQVTRQLEQLFDAEERREIRAIVDAITFANRFNNSWEPWLPGAGSRRRWLGMRPAVEDPEADGEGD